MSTHPPAMTTAELLAACAEDGVSVSVTQLTSWVREGLIPEQLRHRHGRGRGLGTEWLWEPECLQRALIIGRTLAHEAASRGERVRLPRGYDRAALMLAALGYAPDAERLRALLVDGLATFERLLTRRQTYLAGDRPASEKRLALRDHIRRGVNRQMALPTAPVTRSISSFMEALHGLADVERVAAMADVAIVYAHPGALLSLRAMRDRVQEADGRTLLENYQRAETAARPVAALWEWLTTLLTAFVPNSPFVQTTDAGEATILGFTRESVGYLFRLVSTLLLTALPSDQLAAIERGEATPLQTWMTALIAPLNAYANVSLPDLTSEAEVPQAQTTDSQQMEAGGGEH